MAGEDRDSISAQLGYLTRAMEEVHEDVQQARDELKEHRLEAKGVNTQIEDRITKLERGRYLLIGAWMAGSTILTAGWAIITFLYK